MDLRLKPGDGDDKSESQVLYSAQDEIKNCFKP